MRASLAELIEDILAEVHHLFLLHGGIGIFPFAGRRGTCRAQPLFVSQTFSSDSSGL